ncbi:MAG: hypothetical protein ACRCSO_05740 [Sphingomonas sp.]
MAMTKNITLAIDDALLDRYRSIAIQRKTSVNAMIRDHMAETVGARTAAQEAAIDRMIARSKNGPRAMSAPAFDRAALWNRGGSD